jgi:DNA polymerase-1
MLKRFIPLPALVSGDKWERSRAERQAVNYIIQGSAAEIIKMAMIECSKVSYKAILQVHDELIFELPDTEAKEIHLQRIKNIMENAYRLSVPVDVDIRMGNSWAEAKA